LSRQITIQSRASDKDSFGQELVSWTNVCTTRAQIEQLSGSETVAAGMQVGETMHTITIRWRPGLTQGMRVVYQGRVMDILSVVDDFSRHRKLTMLCKEGMTRG